MTLVTGSQTAPLHDRIAAAMMHNSGLFLRQAALQIAEADEAAAAPFDLDRATLVTVLLQTAVELASGALVIRHEGVRALTGAKDTFANDAELERRWRAGTIRTAAFEAYKAKAAAYLGDENFWTIVDQLQRDRNKLVHFHAPLNEFDRFDLKYDATHVLIQVIAALTRSDEAEFVHGCQSFLGLDLFHRLLAWPPYQDRIRARARELDPKPLRCGACGVDAFLRDDETCLSCGYSGEVMLLKCPACSEKAVFYDHLNLPVNPTLEARCGRCEWRGRARHCAVHDLDVLILPGRPECPWCAANAKDD